jgi:ferredoxin
MLEEYLAKRNIVKITSGAGTEDADYIYRLVRLYCIAGAEYFDISAHPSSVIAARKAIIDSQTKKEIYVNCSLGIPGDPHADKARISEDRCISCGACLIACKNEAILSNPYSIKYNRCIGCGYCAKNCPCGAIEIFSASCPVETIVPSLLPHGIDSIELHMAGDIEYGKQQWKMLENCFDGILSVHINRTVCSDKMLINLLDHIIYNRKPHTTTIQADGLSMSASDSKDATLQAIAIAQIVDKQNYPAYIISSGGVNHYTMGYMREFNIRCDGIAYATFARNLVKPYINNPNFFDDVNLITEAVALIDRYIFNEGREP